MSSGKSAYLEAALLDFVLSGVTYTPPTTVYVAFSLNPWSASETGSSITEPGDTYGRVAMTCDTTNWPVASGSDPATKANGTDVVFATATGSWGTIKSVYLIDASGGGNCLYGGDVTETAIGTGSTPTLVAGQIVVDET